jgi:hypothetical protein
MKTGWTPRSIRAFKRLVKRHPQLRLLVEQTLEQMVSDIYHPSLKTHVASNIVYCPTDKGKTPGEIAWCLISLPTSLRYPDY